jgi:hypothetical protein
MRHAGPVSVALFYVRFKLYLFQVCSLQSYLLQTPLLQVYFLEVYLLAGRQAGKLRPLVAQLQHFAHLPEKLRMCIVAAPAPAIAKFDEALLPTLDEDEPSARDTVVRTLLPFRHEESQGRRREIGVKKRALLIRATKMNVAAGRLFVDFLFVDSHTKIDSNERGKFNRAN